MDALPPVEGSKSATTTGRAARDPPPIRASGNTREASETRHTEMRWLRCYSRPTLAAIGCFLLAGCASIDRLAEHPDGPQVYGGTRTWSSFWRDEIGLDAWSGTAGPATCVVLADFPGSLVLDTLALPWTVSAALTRGDPEDEGTGAGLTPDDPAHEDAREGLGDSPSSKE